MYHLKPNGDTGQCHKTTGKCPYGETSEHFHSAHEARVAFEKRQMSFGPLKPKSVLTPEAEGLLHDNTFNAEDHEIDYTPEQVIRKYDADIRNHSFPLQEKLNPGEPGLILEKLFGKEPDSESKADLGSVELKTLRASSINRSISLGALSLEGNSKKLRQLYLGEKFSHVLKAGEWSTIGDYHYSMLVDRKQRKVRIIIADKNKDFVSTNDFGWSFDALEKKVDDKLQSIAVGLYETEEKADGQRAVTFKDMLMGGFSHESLIDKLESGKVNMDFRFQGRYARTTLSARAADFCDLSQVKKAA